MRQGEAGLPSKVDRSDWDGWWGSRLPDDLLATPCLQGEGSSVAGGRRVRKAVVLSRPVAKCIGRCGEAVDALASSAPLDATRRKGRSHSRRIPRFWQKGNIVIPGKGSRDPPGIGIGSPPETPSTRLSASSDSGTHPDSRMPARATRRGK